MGAVIVSERQWDAYMERTATDMGKAVAEGLTVTGERLVDLVAADAPRITGRLAGSYYAEIKPTANGLALKSTAGYAHLVQPRRHHETPGIERASEELPGAIEAELAKVVA